MPENPSNPTYESTLHSYAMDGSLLESDQSARSVLGRMLERCRQYLLLIANEELNGDLRAKAGASDLVQETLLEAYEALPDFRGGSDAELKVWLRRILLNNIANFRRRYRDTAKRQLTREQSIENGRARARPHEVLPADTTSPSGKASRNEEAEWLHESLQSLPEDYRQVLTLRHMEHQSFAEIGRIMHRSTDAARMLWWRAFERLAEILERSAKQSHGAPH